VVKVKREIRKQTGGTNDPGGTMTAPHSKNNPLNFSRNEGHKSPPWGRKGGTKGKDLQWAIKAEGLCRVVNRL